MKLKKLLRYLPVSMQDKIFRGVFSIPEEVFDKDFSVSLATTREDLEASFRLLHDCYVDTGIYESQPSGLRVTLFSILPTTTTIVVKYRGQVVGTVSLVMDTSAGFPSDNVYSKENEHIRKGATRLVEVSALAISKNFRNGKHGVAMLLMKYLYLYSRMYMRSSQLVCVVHPRAEVFYRALMGFERRGQIRNCSYVKNAPGVLLEFSTSGEHFQKVHEVLFGGRNDLKSLTAFVMMDDDRFIFPARKSGQVVDPVMTPELLDYFGHQKSNLYETLTPAQKSVVYNAYVSFYGEKRMTAVRQYLFQEEGRSYRIPTELMGHVRFSSGNVNCIVKILDISSRGCFVAVSQPLPLGEQIYLTLRTSEGAVELVGRPVWRNDKGQSPRLPDGFGIAFEQADHRIANEIQAWCAAPVVEEAVPYLRRVV
ncbi:MAG: PilZ domain-containing protein [Bdellovibrio sp.]